MEVIFILIVSLFLFGNRKNLSSLPSLPSLGLKDKILRYFRPVDENENNTSNTNQNQDENETKTNSNEPYFCDVDPDRYTVGRIGDSKWCLGCGVYLGSLDELGAAKFNRVVRCPPCADSHNRYKRRIARQRRKEQSIKESIQIASAPLPRCSSGAGAEPQVGTQKGSFFTVRSK